MFFRFHFLRKFLRWSPLVFACALTGAVARPVRVGVEINAEPLSFLDAKGQPTGFSAELLRAMAKQGLESEIVEGYWTDILKDFNEGRIDALANVNITDERRALMDFSISHAYLHGIIYLRRDHAPIREKADLAGRKLAVLRGSVTYFTATAKHGWGAEVTAFPSIQI